MTLCSQNPILDNLSFAKPTARAQKAVAVVMIDRVMIAKLEDGSLITSAKDFHNWAYLPGHDLLVREPIVRGLAALGVITAADAAAHMQEHRKAKAKADKQFALRMVQQYAPVAGLELADAAA